MGKNGSNRERGRLISGISGIAPIMRHLPRYSGVTALPRNAYKSTWRAVFLGITPKKVAG
jgi:hypothetical protein